MAIKSSKDVFVTLLSDLWHGAAVSARICEELGKAAQNPEIRHALDVREAISNPILSTLCFRLIGEKPVKPSGHLQEAFMRDFRREVKGIQSPVARRIFILTKATRLMDLRVGEYVALIAAADMTGHAAVGVLLESCLKEQLVFAKRIRRLVREQLQQELVAA